MAKRQRIRVPSAPAVQRKWIENSIRGLEGHLAQLRDRLRSDDDQAAHQYALDQAAAEERAASFRDTREPATRGDLAGAVRNVAYVLQALDESLAHVHYDLVAIRAHLGLVNPGCAPAEEHTTS